MATEDKADPLFIKSELPSVYETLPTIPSTAKESHHVSPGTIRISPAVIRMPTQDKGKNKAISLSSPDYSSEVTASKRRAEVAGPSNTMPGISRPAVTLMKSEEAHVAFMDVDPQHSIPEKRSHLKRHVDAPLRRAVTQEDSGPITRQRKRTRYLEIDNHAMDDEEMWQKEEVDQLHDEESSTQLRHNRPPINHKGIIPRVGTKLRAELLTCDRCWSKDLVCIRHPGGQACKACRSVRMKCSRVFPSCPRRRNLTEEDELRWRVLAIEPPSLSSVRARSGNQGRQKGASSGHSIQHSKRNMSARRYMKTKEEEEDDDESEEDKDPLDKALGDNRRRNSSTHSSDHRADSCAARLEGRMSHMEIVMKESEKTQKQIVKSMKDMSSALLKMSTEMVRSSSSQRSSSDPEMARQLRQLSARSLAITDALDNQGLPIPKDEDDMLHTISKDKALVPRTFQNIGLQAIPVFCRKAVQTVETSRPGDIYSAIVGDAQAEDLAADHLDGMGDRDNM